VRVFGTRVRNTGDRRKRTAAVVTFSLARPALVRFRIQRVAPDCVLVGRFALNGQRGVNTYRFAGRFRGITLPAGTYQLSANAFRRGRFVSLGRAVVVIVPAGEDLKSTRPERSTCGAGDGPASGARLSDASAGGVGSDTEAEGRADEDVSAAAASGSSSSGSGSAGAEAAGPSLGVARDGRILGVLPNPFEDAPAWLQPFLLVALGAAIVLLLAAALPAAAVRPAGAAPVVSQRRSEFALAGAMILGAIAIAALVL